LYSTSTTRRALSRAAMPARAMAAYAAPLSTRPVRFEVRAWSVTTTLAPAGLHSSLSPHLTCNGRSSLNPNSLTEKLRNWGEEGAYLEAGAAADAAPVELGARRGEEAAVEGRGQGAVPARTGCAIQEQNHQLQAANR
jgi:hypothetical protein